LASEGCRLNAALTDRDPIGRDDMIGRSLSTRLRLFVRGATQR